MSLSGSKRGGRTAKAAASEKVNPTLPAAVVRCLEKLADTGLYGTTKTEVAAYLIVRAVDDLVRSGTLQLPIGTDGG
jgi:hypothetical protein